MMVARILMLRDLFINHKFKRTQVKYEMTGVIHVYLRVYSNCTRKKREWKKQDSPSNSTTQTTNEIKRRTPHD